MVVSSFPRLIRVLATAALALALVAAGCSDGNGDDVATDETASTSDTTSQDTGTTTESTASTLDVTTSSTEESTTTETTEETTTTASTLPGDPWDGFAKEGDVLAVMGVAYNDTLNIRAIPGTGGGVVATVAHDATNLVATGQARALPQSAWYEITVNGVTGWVSVSFVAFLGGTTDVTADYLGGNPPPEAETMVALADLVAADFASDEPPSRIVQHVPPSVGDLGEITYDVIGLGDDALAGLRLHIFANPAEDGEGFVLRTIEQTVLCTRGTDGEVCF